jgi:hypothetical protein
MTEQLRKNLEDAEMYFFMEADSETIKQYLKDCDIEEPNKFQKEVILKRLSFLAKAVTNKQRDNQLLLVALKCKDAIERNIDKPVQFLRELMSNKLSTAYNNSLDKLSQEEIIELIKDQNLVNLMNQLEEDGTNNEAEI